MDLPWQRNRVGEPSGQEGGFEALRVRVCPCVLDANLSLWEIALGTLGLSFPRGSQVGHVALRAETPHRDHEEVSDHSIDTVFVDRGGGFYDGTGAATAEFKWALRNNQLKAFHGDDASVQPGRSGDLWPHETAVSWTRQRTKRTLPKEPWSESEEDFGKRLKLAQNYVNANYDVDSLFREMAERMRSLVHDTKGDKLSR